MTEAEDIGGAAPARSARDTPLQALLGRLGNGTDAAAAYEQLRLRLVTYFRLRFAAEAEALADEAFDRLSRRLTDGTDIVNIPGYALGIARLLVLETSARRRKEADAARGALQDRETVEQDLEPDAAMPALQRCLEAIGSESARFILDYYGADAGAARIARRQSLAERAGLSLNALRNRALRIRMGLEQCVRARLRAEATPINRSRSDEIAISDT